jgi:hypothetical protein
MSSAKNALITNHLVDLLSEKERLLLLQHCDVVELEFGTILC